LKTVPLHGKTVGEEMFQSFYANLLEINVPIHKLLLVATDGAQAMATENVCLIELCKKMSLFQTFLFTSVSLISKLCLQK
jgi:hypothetical protein